MNHSLYRWLSFVALWVLGFLIYQNSLGNDFVFDDIHVILENYYIKSFEFLPKIFGPEYFQLFGEQSYRPVVTLTYFADYLIWGLSPFGFHLDNVLLHLINSSLFLLFLKRVFPESDWIFFASALFTLHPVMTETVNSLGFREDLLTVMSALVCLLLFLKVCGKEVHSKAKIALYYFLSLAFFFLGLLSKESLIIFPFLVALVCFQVYSIEDIMVNRQIKAFFAFLGIILVFYLLIRFDWFKNEIPYEKESEPLVSRVSAGIVIIGYYIKLLLFPLPLSVEYTFPKNLGENIFQTGWALFFLALMFRFIWKSKSDGFRFGGLWFLIALIPTMNIYPITHPIAERYLYFRFLGGAVFFAAGWSCLKSNSLAHRSPEVSRFIRAFPMGVLIVFSLLTFNRNLDWKNADTIWESAFRWAPKSHRIWNGLGISHLGRNDFSSAIEAFRRSIELKPNYQRAFVNLGLAYHLYGNDLAAEKALVEGLEINNNNPDMLANMGRVKLGLKKYEESRELLERSLALKPHSAETYLALGNLNIELKKDQEALEAFKKAAEIRPDFPEPWNNIGALMGTYKRYREAVPAFLKALEADPENNEALVNLAVAYYFLNDYENAGKYAKIAKGLGVTLPDLLSPLMNRH